MKKLSMCLVIVLVAVSYSSSSIAMDVERNKQNIVRLQWDPTAPASDTEKLLIAGAEVNEQDAHGNTALYYVIKQNPENAKEKIRILMRYGANPSIKNKAGQSVYDYFANLDPQQRELLADVEAIIRHMDAENAKKQSKK